MKVEKKQSVQGKKRRYKKFCLIALPILLLSVLAGSGIAIAVYRAKYINYASLAQTEIQRLRTAIALLERVNDMQRLFGQDRVHKMTETWPAAIIYNEAPREYANEKMQESGKEELE